MNGIGNLIKHFDYFYSTTMAELQVLSPMLRANEEANAERRLAVNNPNISRRRFVASHLYAMCTMTLLCITTIIITLVKLEQVQNYIFGNCTKSPISLMSNDSFYNQIVSLNLTCT